VFEQEHAVVKYLVAYAATATVFLAVDFLWLSFIARSFYLEKLGGLLLEKPKLGAAAAFYAVYVVGIVIFAVSPGLRSGSLLVAIGYGALFGLFAYATYDMTNYATLKDWPLSVSLIDMIWGACLTASSAAIGFLVTWHMFKP
jgi:uncharacterized membrane protein